MREQFLTTLRENPADVLTWRVFADWLEEQGDETASFIRLSLEITEGRIPLEQLEDKGYEYERMFDLSNSEVRQLLTFYRCSLPTRFRAFSTFQVGSSPPADFMERQLTYSIGLLESGVVRVGMSLVPKVEPFDQQHRIGDITVSGRTVRNEVLAGETKGIVSLGFAGHVQIPEGTLLNFITRPSSEE